MVSKDIKDIAMDSAIKGAITAEAVAVKQKSNARKVASRFSRRPLSVAGFVLVAVMILFALFGNYIAKYDLSYRNSSERFAPPSGEHWFGTDDLGRDIFARVADGAKITITVAFGSSAIALLIGTALGLFTGFCGGGADTVISGLMNSLWALPTIVLAMVINVALGSNIGNIIFSIGIVTVPSFYRIVRSRVLSIRETDYILAATAIGRPIHKNILLHVLPNLVSTLIIETTLACSKAVIAEASLSFLGLGVVLPRASWGTMLKSGYSLIERTSWLSIFPGLMIMLLVLGFNFLGDGLRDAFDVHIQAD